jgi:prepilin-type N-terminal cleavage/methylation domain-containing protein/prepilin-type processing-associated H-X9-DG protein
MAIKNKTNGFTLVELLVVISIIAVLLGVLMPALAAARKSSKQLMCATNLKQIYAAFASYANQNSDAIIKAGEILHTKNSQEVLALWHIVLLPYVGEKFEGNIIQEKFSKVWFCPEDKDPYPQGYKNNPHNGMTSYALNGYYGSLNGAEIKLGPAGSFKFNQIRNPADCMMMGETSYASQFYDIESPKTTAYNLARDGHHRMTSGFYHNKSMNVSYVDGHIGNIKGRRVSVDEKYIPANYKTGKYLFWPELTLPTATELPMFWGPGYY